MTKETDFQITLSQEELGLLINAVALYIHHIQDINSNLLPPLNELMVKLAMYSENMINLTGNNS